MNVSLLSAYLEYPNRKAAIEAVVSSGLLSDDALFQWVERLVKRAIDRGLRPTVIPEWEGRGREGIKQAWENWALKWLSGEDRTRLSANKLYFSLNVGGLGFAGQYLRRVVESAQAASRVGSAKSECSKRAAVLAASKASAASDFCSELNTPESRKREREQQVQDLFYIIRGICIDEN